MSLTVGTDTYISLADARAYVTANSLTPLPAVDADAEKLLKQATTTLDQLYGNKYLGMKATSTQGIAWPRNYFNTTNAPHYSGDYLYATIDSDGNPRDFSGLQPETGYAETELAVMIQAKIDVYAQPKPTVNFEKSKVGTLEQEIHTTDNKSYRVDPLYKISLILRPILLNQTGTIAITRGV
jgi:hypothetical protein